MSTARYTHGRYLEANPGWHIEDSAWKAARILELMRTHALAPASVCEIGCGAGEVLLQLHDRLDPRTRFVGYDLSPQAIELARGRQRDRLRFAVGNPLEGSWDECHDLALAIDVVEHLEDPFSFLRALRGHADRTILHIPLDISVLSVLRPTWLLHMRHSVGHLHGFVRETALALVEDAGYEIVEDRFTDAAGQYPPSTVRRRALGRARDGVHRLSPVLASRLMGGYSLLVLAR